jgi:hypothetical protein
VGAEEAADIEGDGEAAEAAALEESVAAEVAAAEEEEEEEEGDEWSSDGTTYEDGITPRGVAYGDGAGLSEEGEEEEGAGEEEAEEEAAQAEEEAEEAAKEAVVVVVVEEGEGAAGVHAGHDATHCTPRAMYPEEEAGVSRHASRQGWSGPASSVASDLEAAEEEATEEEEEAEEAEAEAAAAPSLAVAFLRAQETEGQTGRDTEGGGGGGGEDKCLFEAQWLAACARAAGEGPEDTAGCGTAEARTVLARRRAAHCNPILSAPACHPLSATLRAHPGVCAAAKALQGCRQQGDRQAAPRQHGAPRRRTASSGGKPGGRGQA